ncbi:alpha-(1,3)-fucosyltransferase C-like [Coccinella septempunctata]|uniref:alpha-(1,3)-fucosyltransferase C-like n=1 Tax=Coccinella septempunctata TaxID=41139 RepID=UPI001D0790B1|nr:alpha-(1,3)-fucosyltransferase C-like [Coccinella septempunctata]
MNRLKFLFFSSSVTLLLCYMYITHSVYSIERGTQKDIPILYWTTMFKKEDFNLGLGSWIFQSCEFSNCFTTSDRNSLGITQFSALIFHHFDSNVNDLPPERSPTQRYIFFTLESPSYTKWKPWDGFYNWTMTYRSDSDIVHPYGYFRKQKTAYQKPSPHEIVEKSGKIAWLVSNCATPSGREELAKEINRYMPVDIIGNCNLDSPLKCPKSSQQHCYKLIERRYKFYLSFENSLCEDYVTEKFFNILKLNLIPIVYGTANYTRIAPPNSYINVKDYQNVSDMVEYLKILDDNPDLYLTYFEWKKDYVIDIYPKQTLCDLCKKLNKPVEYKTLDNLAQWWFSETCEPGYEAEDSDDYQEQSSESVFRSLVQR